MVSHSSGCSGSHFDEFSWIRSDYQVLDMDGDGSLKRSSLPLHVDPIPPLDGDAVRGVMNGNSSHRNKTKCHQG